MGQHRSGNTVPQQPEPLLRAIANDPKSKPHQVTAVLVLMLEKDKSTYLPILMAHLKATLKEETPITASAPATIIDPASAGRL